MCILSFLGQISLAADQNDVVSQLKLQVKQFGHKIDQLVNDVADLRTNIQHLEKQNDKKNQTILALQSEVSNLKTGQEQQENGLTNAGKKS
jgi:peptidoglycan hydrolase CwlO-like protein